MSVQIAIACLLTAGSLLLPTSASSGETGPDSSVPCVSSGEWDESRAQELLVARQERYAVDDARGGDQFVGRIDPHVAARDLTAHVERDRPDVNPSHHPGQLDVIEVEFDAFQLCELRDLPENDSGN